MKILIPLLFLSLGAYSYDAEKFDSFEKDLKQLEDGLHKPRDLRIKYLKSLEIWREIVDATTTKMTRGEGESDKEFQNTFDRHLSLLLRSSQIRSKYIIKVQQDQETTVFEFNLSFFNDLRREIQLVPVEWYAIAYFKILYIKNNLKLGFEGIKTLALDGIILFIVFIIPFIFWRLSKKVILKLTEWRKNFVRQSFRVKNYSLYAELLRLAIDYLPWMVALYSVSLSKNLINKSHFFELSIFYPFISYWIYYRIFRKILSDSLLKIAKAHKTNGVVSLEEKAAKNASLLSLTLLISYSFIYVIESVVSKGLSYYIFQNISLFGIIIILFIIGRDWRNELSVKVAEYNIPHISDWISQRLIEPKHFYMCLPVLLLILGFNVLMFLVQWSGRFEFVKTITAEMFKRKLESSEIFEESELQDLPTDYQELFNKSIEDDPSLYSLSKNSKLKIVCDQILEWKKDIYDENSIFIAGDKGAGKTTLLMMIEKEISTKGIQVIRTIMPSRILTEHDFLKFIGHVLGVDMGMDYSVLEREDKNFPQTLIMIDESQNSFLSCIGGFDCFKSILKLVNARLENIFFIFSFNSYSWSYLNSAFGKNQYFRNFIELSPFTDKDIKDLIMKRHALSDYKLSFRDIMKATKGAFEIESVELIEDQFFRLLWEQSLGNPKTSLYMWQSSLKYRGGKNLKVGLPHDDVLDILSNLSEDTLFIYSAIVKHENLSTSDAVKVTSLPESVVRFAMKLGLDNEVLIRRKSGDYTLNVRFQHTLVNYLKKKNLIYAC